MIVIKVKVSNNKFVHIMNVYRQWKLLNSNNPNSNLLENQMERLRGIMSTLTKLRDDGKETLL